MVLLWRQVLKKTLAFFVLRRKTFLSVFQMGVRVPGVI